MKDIVTKTIAGVLAGVILYFVTDKYLSKHDSQPEQVKATVEDTIQLGIDRESSSTPEVGMSQSPRGQDQEIQNIPALEELGPPEKEVRKPVEEASSTNRQPIEHAATASSQKAAQRSAEEEMALMEREARTKRDSLTLDSLLNTQVKKVNKRSADIFEELEEHTRGDTVPQPPN
jgi:hypothetical protein